MTLPEAKTRAILINPQMEAAGWTLSDRSRVAFEAPVRGCTFMNMGKLSELSIPLPPRSEQGKFLQSLTSYERLRTTLLEALRQADHLFKSLLHQAFYME